MYSDIKTRNNHLQLLKRTSLGYHKKYSEVVIHLQRYRKTYSTEQIILNKASSKTERTAQASFSLHFSSMNKPLRAIYKGTKRVLTL